MLDQDEHISLEASLDPLDLKGYKECLENLSITIKLRLDFLMAESVREGIAY